MEIKQLEKLWAKAQLELLDKEITGIKLNILAKQTYDSIRRIEIYKTYGLRAIEAVKENMPFIHTSNPFVLAQRTDLNSNDRVWIIYLATYFGKSNKSKWTLFNRATFDKDDTLIKFDQIQSDLDEYFKYLNSFDFFNGCSYSNHRKYTAKKLYGDKGLFKSIEFFVSNIESYVTDDVMQFHEMYKLAQKIPNFGRLGGFDFTSALVKSGLNVAEPKSMYAEHSTGPLDGLKLLLKLTGNNTSLTSQKELAIKLMDWFSKNSKIFMVGQVLEDCICNWQKNTTNYIRYTG